MLIKQTWMDVTSYIIGFNASSHNGAKFKWSNRYFLIYSLFRCGEGGWKKYDLTITVGVKSCCTTCLKFPSPLNNNLKTRFFLAGWPIADIIRRHMGIYSHTHKYKTWSCMFYSHAWFEEWEWLSSYLFFFVLFSEKYIVD